MLSALHIENIAVIKSLDVELGDRFTALTGETGAGKSIVVDSISLLMGGRFRPEMLRTGENEAVVGGLFREISPENLALLSDLGFDCGADDELYVQRNFTSDGKTQTRINGRSVALSLLRSVMNALVNIHGQHDNQKLLDPHSHSGLLDAWAEDTELVSQYAKHYLQVKDREKQIDDAFVSETEKERLLELLKYQAEEIFSVNPAPGEDEILEQKRVLLKDIEKNRKHVQLIYRALYRNDKGVSAGSLIDMSCDSLEAISAVFPEADGYVERLDRIKNELEEIALSSLSVIEDVSADPQKELDETETRLAAIKKLKKKYGPDIESVINFGHEAKKKLDELESSDLLIAELKKKLSAAKECAAEASQKLHDARRKAADQLENLICRQLSFLDMNNAVFKVEIGYDPDDMKPNGCDSIEFLLSANQGETAKPLSQIASGGELARIMLGIKSVFAEKEGTQTLIYDEIDTGISGKTAQKLGLVMKSCAQSAQVICVTHSAQIAAAADHHMLVSKSSVDGRTMTQICQITGEDRINEVARIMGGNNITQKLRESAEDLINETK